MHSIVRKALTLALTLIPVFAGCSGKTTEPGAAARISGNRPGDYLDILNDEGTVYRCAGSTNALKFTIDARSPAGEPSVIRLTLPGLTIDASVDVENRSLIIDGHDAIVTTGHRRALASMAAMLQDAVPLEAAHGSPLTHSPLVRLVDYLAQAPLNDRFRRIQTGCSVKGSDPPPAWYGAFMLHAETARCSADEGITCIVRGSTVNADYDDARGCHADAVVVGSTARKGYECMGRCGPGCTRGAPSAWTKDCLDHDQCSHKNQSSGGLTDSNCGDEYRQAADDWLFGVLKGCRG